MACDMSTTLDTCRPIEISAILCLWVCCDHLRNAMCFACSRYDWEWCLALVIMSNDEAVIALLHGRDRSTD